MKDDRISFFFFLRAREGPRAGTEFPSPSFPFATSGGDERQVAAL